MDPWDMPVKSKAKQTRPRLPYAQENFKAKLMDNLCSSDTVMSTGRCTVSAHKLQKVIQQFQLDLKDDRFDELSVTSKSITSTIRPADLHGENPRVPLQIMALEKIESFSSRVASSKPSVLPSVLRKRGSFLNKSGLTMDLENTPPASYCPSPEHVPISSNVYSVEPISSDNQVIIIPKKNQTATSEVIMSPVRECNLSSASLQPSSVIESRSARAPSSRSSRTSVGPTKNYLKLNLRQKCFSRKGSAKQRMLQRKVRFSKFKRKFDNMEFNQVKQETSCFRCGQTGHWAKKCPLTIGEKKREIDVSTDERYGSKLACASWKILSPDELDERFLAPQFDDLSAHVCSVKLASSQVDLSLDEMRIKCHHQLDTCGFSAFRPGQELVVLRVLMGVSTLAVLPTAAGKSLCYQLPALIFQVGRRRLKWTTAAYHAGMTTTERSRVQQRFMLGRVRVLVATSAFGMGLNKADLQAVIHYSLTKSFENYVQEIGRVGRAQQVSYCHTFVSRALTTDPEEANEIRRHIFANHIDPVMLKRLMRHLFRGIQCTCRPDTKAACSGHVHAIDPVAMGDACDVKTESLATLMAYMELEPGKPLISILQPGFATATVDCYGGPAEMAHASQRCLAVAAGLGLESVKHDRETVISSRQLVLNLPELCNRWGWTPSTVRQELKSLEWDSITTDTNSQIIDRHTASSNNTGRRTCHRTGIQIAMSQWSWWFWVHAPGAEIESTRLDQSLQYLYKRLRTIERTGLDSVNCLTQALAGSAAASVDAVYPSSEVNVTEELLAQRNANSAQMHQIIEKHFASVLNADNVNGASEECSWPPPVVPSQVTAVRGRVREFIQMHGHDLGARVNGRTLANLFHGISTPQFSIQYWSRNRRFWRAHLDIDWLQIKRIATEELLSLLH